MHARSVTGLGEKTRLSTIAGRSIDRTYFPDLPMSPRKLRVLLVDDHEIVRAGLRMLVNAQPDMEVVAEAGDGRSALEQAHLAAPDVVVMDVSMPRLNGLKATEALRQIQPDLKVLTLTRHAHDGYVRQLLASGASGYVLKQSRPTELLTAIRAVAGGRIYMDPAMGDAAAKPRSAAAPDPTGRINKRSALSPREDEVLRLIAWGHSNADIASRLELSVKTIETHKANAMQKRGLHNRMDIVRFALLQGWLEET
jgi:two-component system response regulator NreC